jgi:eukaryotic-like serine/threonine-protein kinase
MYQEQLTPGFVIAGKYVVERALGRGGMGAVYVVSHANTGKRLALKVLLPEFVHNADIVGRFLREAQVMGRLQHRHVVDVFDVGRDGDVLFIVMELLDGKPLSDLLHDETLTLEEALVILIRAMDGIAAAHEVSVVHRDVKPDNIFVCVGASGRLDDPRVLDFGISKLDDNIGQQLTRSGVAMGTPYYMSIEQLNGQRDLDARVDVYAMGVILYEAISGTTPYTADSISALAIRVLTTQPVHLAQLRPDLPSGLADVVMKAMAKNRDDRFRSMRQLIEALRPFVPRSSGLLVPEGQSRPLRTPGGSARTPARARSVVQSVGTSAPFPFAPFEPELPDTPARGSGRTLTVVAMLAVLTAAGVAAFVLRGRLDDPTSVAAPTPSAPAPEPAPPAAAEVRADPVVPAPAPVAPAPTRNADAPSVNTTTDEPSSPARTREAAGSKESRATPRSRVGKKREVATPTAPPASTPPPPVVAQPAAAPTPPTPTPTRKSAEGRAGKLGSDEF